MANSLLVYQYVAYKIIPAVFAYKGVGLSRRHKEVGSRVLTDETAFERANQGAGDVERCAVRDPGLGP